MGSVLSTFYRRSLLAAEWRGNSLANFLIESQRENMFDPKVLSEYALSNMDFATESIQNRLNLFQTFKRLYEQNPALLSEILNLATLDKQMPVHPGNFSYVLGLVTDKQALLITNVSEDRSQIFLQPQLNNQIWTFGRDPNKASLPIRDRRLSRCHAAIRYDATCGFLLYDLASTNGTYVNGVRIRQSYILRDGDLIRLGSMNFGFFTGAEFRRVGDTPPEVLQLISEATVPPTAPMDDDGMPETISDDEALPPNLEPTLHFMSGTEFAQE